MQVMPKTTSSPAEFDKASKMLRQAKLVLTIKDPHLMASGISTEFVLTDEIATACTDGAVTKINPRFLAGMSQAQANGLIAHENMHVSLGHPWRIGSRDVRLFNIAGDCQINAMCNDLGYELPDAGINYDVVIRKLIQSGCPSQKANSIRGESVEYTYEILKEYSEKGGKQPPGKPPGNQPNNTPNGNPGGPRRPIDDIPDSEASVTAAPKKQDPQSKIAEQLGRLEAAIDMVEKAESADKQIQNGTKRSRIPGALKSLIKKARTNKVDWRSALWKFVSGGQPTDYSFNRINKFYVDDGIYVPVIERKGVGPIAVCIDTSGSIGEKMLSAFMAEVEAILDTVRPESIIIIPCDAAVHEPGITVLYPGDTFETKDFGGRGGTSFKPPFEYLERHDIHVTKVIYLTDMEGDFPSNPGIDTLWVSTVAKNNKAPFGDVVVVDIS